MVESLLCAFNGIDINYLRYILGSSFGSGSHSSAARRTFSSARSNGLPSATAAGGMTVHTQSTVQKRPSEVSGGNSSIRAFGHRTNTSVEPSTIAGSRARSANPVRTKGMVANFNPVLVKLPSRREAVRVRVSDEAVGSSRVTDSPEPDSYALRKRPGQSIFKAPGQQQHNSG